MISQNNMNTPVVYASSPVHQITFMTILTGSSLCSFNKNDLLLLGNIQKNLQNDHRLSIISMNEWIISYKFTGDNGKIVNLSWLWF